MQFTLVKKKVMNSRIRFPFNIFFLNPVYVAARSLRSNYKKALPKYVQQKQCFSSTQSPSERKYASSYKSFKAKSERAIRLHSCESIFIIFAPSYVNFSRQHRFKCCNLHDLFYIYLDNGVMTTPKRRILSFVFTVLCFKKSLLKD